MASTPVAPRRPATRATRPPAGRTGSTAVRRPVRQRPPARREQSGGWGKPLLVVLAIGALLVLALNWEPPQQDPTLPTGCTVAGSSLDLTTDEAANAATIAAVARTRGLPPRATVIALATAQQESRLRNLDHGDRDSLGLFQQRPSQGWGSPTQVQDPVYAAGKFLDGLVQVRGWETGRLTDVAQAVQRSGFPEAYQKWEGMATTLGGALLSGAAGQLSCSYPATGELGSRVDRAQAVAGTASTQLALPATADATGAVSVPGAAGWPGASWAVAHAEQFHLTEITFAGQRWTPTAGWTVDPAAGADAVRLRLAR